MPIKKKPKSSSVQNIESAPNKSLLRKSPGKPSFKQGIGGIWKKRMVELPEEFIRECGIKKVNGEIDGLDHAIYLALKNYLNK